MDWGTGVVDGQPRKAHLVLMPSMIPPDKKGYHGAACTISYQDTKKKLKVLVIDGQVSLPLCRRCEQVRSEFGRPTRRGPFTEAVAPEQAALW